MVELFNQCYAKNVLKEAQLLFKEHKNMTLPLFLSEDGLKKFKDLKWKKKFDPKVASYSVAAVPKWLRGKKFLSVLSELTGSAMKIKYVECQKFSPGDYTVLFDKLSKEEGIGFVLFVNEHLPKWESCWGGYRSFIENNKEVVRLFPKANSLVVINQNGLKSFTKYLNHRGSSFVQVVGTLLPK